MLKMILLLLVMVLGIGLALSVVLGSRFRRAFLTTMAVLFGIVICVITFLPQIINVTTKLFTVLLVIVGAIVAVSGIIRLIIRINRR